jgi:hypothetical protein
MAEGKSQDEVFIVYLDDNNQQVQMSEQLSDIKFLESNLPIIKNLKN